MERTGPIRTTVVVATRDRRDELLHTLTRLRGLPERPPLVVVDNASGDGTPAAVREAFPHVALVQVAENLGAAARNLGALRADTPYVAFSDDDSWWEPGCLWRAEAVLDDHPSLALVAARILVGEEARLDPTSAEMAASPLPPAPAQPAAHHAPTRPAAHHAPTRPAAHHTPTRPAAHHAPTRPAAHHTPTRPAAHQAPTPGPGVLGFLACAAVVRRSAFLAVGGFDPILHIGSEEELLALDLAAAGWGLVYRDDVVAHHHPSARRDGDGRRRLLTRNALWTAWLRRRGTAPLTASARLVAGARDAATRAGVRDALAEVSWALRSRRPLPERVERARRLLDRRPPTGG